MADPVIPPEAVEAAAKAYLAFRYPDATENGNRVRPLRHSHAVAAALAAALPHLQGPVVTDMVIPPEAVRAARAAFSKTLSANFAAGGSELAMTAGLAAALPHLRPLVEAQELRLATSVALKLGRQEARAKAVADLRYLALARKDYCQRCPEHQGDMAEMTPMELAVHDGHATAAWLADILEGTNSAHGWLPSWRWNEWPGARDTGKGESL